jgi:hypothetical protein
MTPRLVVAVSGLRTQLGERISSRLITPRNSEGVGATVDRNCRGGKAGSTQRARRALRRNRRDVVRAVNAMPVRGSAVATPLALFSFRGGAVCDRCQRREPLVRAGDTRHTGRCARQDHRNTFARLCRGGPSDSLAPDAHRVWQQTPDAPQRKSRRLHNARSACSVRRGAMRGVTR